MRRWLFALAAAALLVALGVAVAVRNLDAWLDANHAAIAQQAEQALGREIAFDDVGISLARGLSVRVAGLRVGDDPAFSSEPFLVAEAVEVRMQLWPALHGRIEVERVLLRAPRLTVTALAQGLSTQSLGRPARESAAPPAAPPPDAAASALAIALVDVEDGTLRYVDRTREPPLESVATRFDFEASDVRPGAPIAFELAAAVLGAERQNLRASGTLGPVDAPDPALDVALSLAPLDLATALRAEPLAHALPAALVGTGEARVEATARGSTSELVLEARIDADDAELRLGTGLSKPRGRPFSLSLRARRHGSALEIEQADLALDETRLSFAGRVEDLAAPKARFRATSPSLALASFGSGAPGEVLRDLELEGSLEGGRLEIPRLHFSAYSGTVDAHGSARLRGASASAFEARVEGNGLRLEEVLAGAAPGAAPRASGRVALRLTVSGAWASGDTLATTLDGDGDIEVAEGMLRGFNPAASALNALIDLPVLSGKKLRRLRESRPQVFAAEDSAFESFTSRLEMRDGRVFAHDARLVAPDWVITGKGRWSFARELDAKALLAFSSALSDDALAAEPALRFLRSTRGELEFPVAIRGSGGRIGIEPDVSHLARTASREAVTDALGKALSVVPGVPPAEGEPSTKQSERAPRLKDVGRDLLRHGRGLLGKPHEDE